MADIEDLIKVLHEWKERETKTVLQVLQRVSALPNLKGRELETVTSSIGAFHREIGREEELTIDNQWFPLCIQIKKKLKKMAEIEEKAKKEKPELTKKPSIVIDYPPTLTAGKGTNDQQILKYLYKSFLTNYSQGGQRGETVTFIHTLLKELKYMFEDKSDHEMTKRINSICLHLARENSRESKGKMLEGTISPKDVALNDEEVFMDEEARQRIWKAQLLQLQESRTGFYDEMKKNINKDASEQCRFCHKKKAYCEDMKQIRASDEPMTRFMHCNSCNKKWRD